jgi:hypothetical protein
MKYFDLAKLNTTGCHCLKLALADHALSQAVRAQDFASIWLIQEC